MKEAHDNKVVISNSILNAGAKSYVTALYVDARTDLVEMSRNSVTFSNSTIDCDIQGTRISTTDRASVSDTAVEVSNGSNIGGYVGGDFVSAYSGDVIAEGERSVSVSDSTIGGYIQGIFLSTSYGNASAQGGSVSVSHSVVGSYIQGDNVAASEGSASVFGGSVSVSSGTTVKGFISGFSVNAKKAIAEGGSVSVSNSEVGLYIHGLSLTASNGNASAQGGSVSVSETTVGGDITGFSLSATGGDAIAQGGSVFILNNSTVKGYVFGASTTVKQNSSATSRASGNTVTIENSKIGNLVYGGYAVNKSSGIAEASGNILTLKNVNAPSFIIPGFAWNSGSESSPD